MRHATGLMLAGIVLAGTMAAGEPGRVDAAAAFARLKTLAGNWEASGGEWGTAHLTYTVVSGGSVVMERFNADKLPPGGEMITMYHLDGDRLLLTHYCMAQNQPRMVATRYEAASGELDFEFLDATNLKPGAGHMHSARFKFLDTSRLSSSWSFFQDGKTKNVETAEYKRVR